MGQLSLFDLDPAVQAPPPAIPGLLYLPGFCSAQEEADLIAAVEAEPWSHEYRRRRQHYGIAYDAAARLRPMPAWVEPLARRLQERGLMPKPDGCLVNEYLPGQGIAPHRDRPGAGPVVASLSLGSGCLMQLRRDDRVAEIWLARRSLLVLSGQARELWKHGIAARKTDPLGDRRLQRDRRISITLRCRP